MIKIFYNDKSIFLSDKKPIDKAEKNIFIKEIASKEEMMLEYLAFLGDDDLKKLYLISSDAQQLSRDFLEQFQYIEAAGGLVSNSQQQRLFIFRLGKWDLPKGKVEKGETVEVAAIREVEEECGITKLEITNELPSTYHIYTQKGIVFLKRTYWFTMTCTDEGILTPQQEEGITEVKWLGNDMLQRVYDNTYESIKDVLQEIK